MEEYKNQDQDQENSNKEMEKERINPPDENGVRTYALGAREKKKSVYKGVIIFAIIVLAILVLAVSCNNTIGKMFSMGYPEGAGDVSLPTDAYIATLYVEGTIAAGNIDYFGGALGYQHDWTLDKLDTFMEDSNNKGVIFFVNSPGGGVYESDELYLKIKEYQEVTGRPVYAYFGSMAASGGYYISAPADQIFANRNCWTGSIGVTIGTLFDLTGLLEKYGIQSETITSGDNKAMGSNFDELTTEQREIFQSLVDEAYYQFAGIVSEERELPMERVLEIADGRIYTATQAKEIGLVDEISTFDEAVAHMQHSYNLGNAEVVDVKYTQNPWLSSLLGSLSAGSAGEVGQLSLLLEMADQKDQVPISYTSPYLK